MVGANTVRVDNPLLTTRFNNGKSPIRVIISSNPIENSAFNILENDGIPTLLFNKKKNLTKDNKEWIQFDGTLKSVLKILAEKEIQSVIVEGGRNILDQFISENLWDEAYSFIGNIKFSEGKKAPKIIKPPTFKKQIGNDRLLVYYNQ